MSDTHPNCFYCGSTHLTWNCPTHPSSAAASPWRPFSEAPKDGKPLLVRFRFVTGDIYDTLKYSALSEAWVYSNGDKVVSQRASHYCEIYPPEGK